MTMNATTARSTIKLQAMVESVRLNGFPIDMCMRKTILQDNTEQQKSREKM